MYSSLLSCVALCCSVWQCVQRAAHKFHSYGHVGARPAFDFGNVCVSMCINVVQCGAVWCSVVQCVVESL